MPITIDGTSGVTFPAGGVGNPAGTAVGTTDTQTLTNKTLTSPTIGGTPVVNGSLLTNATSQATTSGTSKDFTSIPSWVTRITVVFQGVSTAGTSNLLIQLGTSGGIVSSGYLSTASNQGGGTTVNSTAGFLATAVMAATDVISGTMTICLLGSNNWVASGVVKNNSGGTMAFAAGDCALGGQLTQLRVTTALGSVAFDAGSVNIQYE